MAGKWRLEIDPRSIARAGDAVAGAAQAGTTITLLAAGTSILLRRLREAAPVRSGRLRQSIVARGQGLDGRPAVGFWGLAYGRYVAKGTRPHLIGARNGRVLAFARGGRVIFARQVRHPGTRPNDFPRRAAQQAEPALRALLREEGDRIMAGIEERSR